MVWKPTTACSCVHKCAVTDEIVPNYIKSFLSTLWLDPFSTFGWNQSDFVTIPNSRSYTNTYLRGFISRSRSVGGLGNDAGRPVSHIINVHKRRDVKDRDLS